MWYAICVLVYVLQLLLDLAGLVGAMRDGKAFDFIVCLLLVVVWSVAFGIVTGLFIESER